jgi:hypothetical protein
MANLVNQASPPSGVVSILAHHHVLHFVLAILF